MLALALVCATALADERTPAATPLQSFVADLNVVIVPDQWVGAVVSSDANVNAGIDSVFPDASQFAASLDEIADLESPDLSLPDESPAPNRVAGTGSCSMAQQPARILCPGYRAGPGN